MYIYILYCPGVSISVRRILAAMIHDFRRVATIVVASLLVALSQLLSPSRGPEVFVAKIDKILQDGAPSR